MNCCCSEFLPGKYAIHFLNIKMAHVDQTISTDDGDQLTLHSWCHWCECFGNALTAFSSSILALALPKSWWRHQKETFSALLAICAGNSPLAGEFPHKGQWRGVLMFSLICAWINGWVNSREAGDLRRHRAYYDVIVMISVSAPEGLMTEVDA